MEQCTHPKNRREVIPNGGLYCEKCGETSKQWTNMINSQGIQIKDPTKAMHIMYETEASTRKAQDMHRKGYNAEPKRVKHFSNGRYVWKKKRPKKQYLKRILYFLAIMLGIIKQKKKL